MLFPMFLFGGIFFPLTGLPQWAQQVAWWLPLTHLVDVCRALALGRVDWSLLPHIAWFLIGSVPIVLLAIHLMRRRLVA